MRVGWLVDRVDVTGGAELTQAELRAATPSGVEVVDCPPGQVDESCDQFVIHNCMTYTLADLEPLTGRRVVKYHHDVGPWLPADVKAWLARNAEPVCCSPIQAEYMGLDAHLIPPPVNLARFAEAAARVNGDRAGVVSVAAWGNHDKAAHRVAEWSVQNETSVDFYGGGALAPPGSQQVAYERMPDLLASYETFVFLPTALEPFGRLVAEAWAAGCKIVTNGLVGARYWIEERPEAIETAAADFWSVVCEESVSC
jgi:glycosyltransferase involved in cell wall biosynthesis